MKLTRFSAISLAIVTANALDQPKQWFPLTRKGEVPEIEPYLPGQDVFIDCISRNIETGEHKFDTNNRIVYTAFPLCKETGKPLTFHYGVQEDINCTITFTDELYHLFQLYVHEDAPFSCRVPLSTTANYLELGGAHVPLTFNLRGEVHDSHLDIDPNLNVIFTKPRSKLPEKQSIVSSIAWSSGTNATRVIIGDSLTLQLAVRWYDHLKPAGSFAADSPNLPYADGFYRLPMNVIPMSWTQYIITVVLVALVSFIVSFAFNTRFRKAKRPYDHFDPEFGKRD